MAQPIPGAMRGLTIFISDLRNAQSKQQEDKRVYKELAHIRNTFKQDKKVDGYNRKKYVAKLLYIHLLGYEVDFGHMEALRLLSSSVYQEKQIGYMALGILLHENHDLIPLIVNSCKVDLESRNSMFQALALSAIANIGGKEMADALAPMVLGILTNSTTKAFVLKRASLCLLRLYRTFPDVVVPDDVVPILKKLLKSNDMGVQLSAAGLLIGVAKKDPEQYTSMREVCAMVLHRIVVQKQYKKQYLFYGLPSPWLQIKLLRFQRYFASPGAEATDKLDASLKAIFATASQEAPASKGVNYRNARHAVLQEAVALVVQQRRRPELMRQSVAIMGRFVTAKATNVRYLALDSMAHLANMGSESLALRRHVDTVIGMLKDKDISIRRRALDVLYCMCDDKLAKKIVSELLRYLIVADYEIREELVVKIAVLAEKFATVYSWYVDVILQLISIAGDYVADDIWYRVVQIVTNHEDIQEYAAAMVFEALHHASCHEATVKVGGYILGEFGHLIADDEGCGPMEQFRVLNAKFAVVSLETRALLLSAFIKLANLYSELTEPVEAALERSANDLDVEMQKRSLEYLALLNRGDDELLASVLDVMPAFPDRGSLVLEAAERKRAAAAGPVAKANDDDDDEDAFEPVGFVDDNEIDAFEGGADESSDGDDDESEEPEEVRIAREEAERRARKAAAKAAKAEKKSKKKKSKSDKAAEKTAAAAAPATGDVDLLGGSAPGGVMADLLGLDLTMGASTTPVATPAPTAPAAGAGTLADLFAGNPAAPAADPFGSTASTTTANASAPGPLRSGGAIDVALRLLTAKNDGVLFEDGSLQIGVKSSFENGSGQLTLFHGNKQAGELTPFGCTLVPSSDVSVAQIAAVPGALGAQSQIQQALTGITALRPFAESPTVAVQCGNESFSLRLPLVPTKFCAPVTLSAEVFFQQWAKLDGAGAYQEVLQAGKPVSSEFCTVLLQAARLAALTGVDPNATNAVGCGKFVVASGTPLGVLVRIEPSAQAKAYRLSVRTGDPALTKGVAAMLSSHLTAP